MLWQPELEHESTGVTREGEGDSAGVRLGEVIGGFGGVHAHASREGHAPWGGDGMLRRGQGRDELGSVRFRDDELARVDALVQAVDGEEVAAVARLALVVPRLHAAGALVVASHAAIAGAHGTRERVEHRGGRLGARLGPRRATRGGGRRQTHRQTRGAQETVRVRRALRRTVGGVVPVRGGVQGDAHAPVEGIVEADARGETRANHVRRRRGRRLHASRLLLVPAAHRRGCLTRPALRRGRRHPRDTTADLARRAI